VLGQPSKCHTDCSSTGVGQPNVFAVWPWQSRIVQSAMKIGVAHIWVLGFLITAWVGAELYNDTAWFVSWPLNHVTVGQSSTTLTSLTRYTTRLLVVVVRIVQKWIHLSNSDYSVLGCAVQRKQLAFSTKHKEIQLWLDCPHHKVRWHLRAGCVEWPDDTASMSINNSSLHTTRPQSLDLYQWSVTG